MFIPGFAIASGLGLIAHKCHSKGWKLTSWALFSLGCFILLVLEGLSGWARHLGADSFSEAQDFNWEEAWFFFSTLTELISKDVIRKGVPDLTTYLVLLIVIFRWNAWFKPWVMRLLPANLSGVAQKFPAFSRRAYWLLAPWVGLILVGSTVTALTLEHRKAFVDNTEIFEAFQQNFATPEDPTAAHHNPMDVYVYIGESTTSMHMGLYGYHRNTTPKLNHLAETDEGMLAFRNFVSPHTHTTPSLMLALSSAVPEQEGKQVRPLLQSFYITTQKRANVVSVLNFADVATRWISNQSPTGTWNMASSVIASHARELHWSAESRATSNLQNKLDILEDLTFFKDKLSQLEPVEGSSISFLHGYATHGHYDVGISPDFIRPFGDEYSQQDPIAVLGKKVARRGRNVSSVDQYDSAVAYIDYALDALIQERAIASDKPTVFIYFSDHGEAPMANRGHSSERFLFEMMQVPFIVYINEAARQAYPQLFVKLQQMQQAGDMQSLILLPNLLMELFDVQSVYRPENFSSNPDIRDYSPLSVVRQIAAGKAAVVINAAYEQDVAVRMNDELTDAFITSMVGQNVSESLCIHRANSMAKAVRSFAATDCVEADFMVLNGQVKVTHDAEDENSLDMATLWRLARNQSNKSIWLDAKNIDIAENCHILADEAIALQAEQSMRQVLVEFPPSTSVDNIVLQSCADKLRQQQNFFTSYYLPTGLGKECVAELKTGAAGVACVDFNQKIDQALASSWFTDLSFEIGLLEAVENHPSAASLRWNSWGVKAQSVSELPSGLFRFLITKAGRDPNKL